MVDENDVKSYALSIVEDPENRNLLFLGTDDGLYVSLDAGKGWTKWTEGFPTVSTKDLVIHPREHDLVIGTFGRAAWVLDDIRPLRAIAKDRSILNKEIALFDTPTAYQAAYQQPTGSRFGADAIFNGENRKDGARITFYLNKKEGTDEASDKEEEKEDDAKDEKKATKDSINLMIYDGERLIRTLKIKTPRKNGIYYMYWDMDERGADRPSRKLSKNKNPKESGGVLVKPGTYKVKIEFGDLTDETTVTVKSDPRLDVSAEAITTVYEKGKYLEQLQQTTADAVKQLAQSKETASEFQRKLKEQDKEKYKDAIKTSKDISKKIDSLMAIYIGKEDKRQGITRNPDPNVNQRIQTAGYYVGSRKTGITTTEEQLIRNAEASLKEALEKTNAFFKNEWKAYREIVEEIDLSPFKETQTFKM